MNHTPRMIALLVPALTLTVMFGATHASAGSLDHSPRWRQNQNQSTIVVLPPNTNAPGVNNPPSGDIVVEEQDETTIPGGNYYPGSNQDAPCNPPKAAPTPSALGAGLLLMGGALARRRRQA